MKDSPDCLRQYSVVPGPGGTSLHYVTFPSGAVLSSPSFDGEAARRESLDRLSGLADHFEKDDPGMHKTNTVDYAVVVDGEIWLELDDAAPSLVRLCNRIAPFIASRDRLRVCVCTRADDGPLARSARTVLCRTQGGWFGMGRVSRFPAFSRESVGHERHRSADCSGIVGASGYHEDYGVRTLCIESCYAKCPGRPSIGNGRTIQETSRHRRQIGDKINWF
jgi:hypothetical protein